MKNQHRTGRIDLCGILAVLAFIIILPSVASAAAPNLCPPGSSAGRCDNPESVAVDQSSGTIYVGDRNNNRIDVFDSTGHFLRAFGFGVIDGANELQTCISACIQGRFGLLVTGLAVDNSSGSSASDLYAVNGMTIDKYRLNPLTEEYELILSFGSVGSGPGQFSVDHDPIAVDELGHLWVGDKERIEEFSDAGAFLGEVAITGRGTPRSLAIDSAGDFYVHSDLKPGVTEENGQNEPVPGVQKFKPNGELIETLDESGHPNSVALDPASGNVIVSDQFRPEEVKNSGKAILLEFGPSGSELEAFASGEVTGGPVGNALAFGSSAQHLYVANNRAGGESAVQAFALPEPGPQPISGTTLTEEVTKASANLCAEVNPEGASSTGHFQYIDATQFVRNVEEGHDGFTGAGETGDSSIGEDFSPHRLCQPVSSLEPATAYRFRIVAHNVKGEGEGEVAEFHTLPPAAIDSTGVTAVTADSATLQAEINPLGDATSYRFEFLTEARLLQNEAEELPLFTGATQAPLEPAAIGAGNQDVAVSQHLQGLLPRTAYRFRVVALNAVSEAYGGPFGGPVHAFTTEGAGTAALPDRRAYEQVSPLDKHGADLVGIGDYGTLGSGSEIQAAAQGDAITYIASAPTESQPQGFSGSVQVLSKRDPEAGWSSVDLNAPHSLPTAGNLGLGQEYRFFSTDLSLGILQPFGAFEPAVSPAASEQTPFLRTGFQPGDPAQFCTSSCYRPLVSGCPASGACPAAVAAAADVPPGTEFGGEIEGICQHLICGPIFDGATPDLGHVVISSPEPLTGETTAGESGAGDLYEWSAATSPSEALRLVSVLPDGHPVAPSAQPALGYVDAHGNNTRGAISSDGSRVVFAAGTNHDHLYLRINADQAQSTMVGGECAEPAKACTVQVDAMQGGPGGAQPPNPRFELAAADGTRVFFTDTQQLTADSGAQSHSGGDLYEYDLSKPIGARVTDLTPESDGEAAGVQGFVLGASTDGAYAYFVADGVLTGAEANPRGEIAKPGNCDFSESSGPLPGHTCNLYLRHEGVTSFVAGLPSFDGPSWGALGSLKGLTARVSPDGRWLAFMSQRQLTGYDNRDAASGEPDEEVFLYHAAGVGSLVCASCNPSGARPHGVEFLRNGANEPNMPLAGGQSIWPGNRWLAANIPGWTNNDLSDSLYQSRYLSNEGRLFFNSPDALAPSDSNGQVDVYQWEPPSGGEEAPAGDTCTTGSLTYSSGSGGCVDLISSGTSAREAAFLDASENGTDVFFLTTAQLAKTDPDTSLDVYDARSGGGFPEAAKAVECSGDACQQPATPPEHPTPGSALLNGPGNEHPLGKHRKHHKHHKKHKRDVKHKRGGRR